jgi:hypothetical protein
MSEFFKYGFYVLSGGLLISVLINIVLIRKMEIGDQINIKKQVQKNRKSPNNTQEYQANQEQAPENKNRRKLRLIKNRKNEKQ